MSVPEALERARDERLLHAIAAADKASTSMIPFGPMNDKWMRAFLSALETEGLTITDARAVAEAATLREALERICNLKASARVGAAEEIARAALAGPLTRERPGG